MYSATEKLSGLLPPERIFVGLEVANKGELFLRLAETAASELGIAADDVLETLRTREDLGTTGVGRGVAIPHSNDWVGASLPPAPREIGCAYAALFVLKEPIRYDEEHELVDVVFMSLSRKGEHGAHLCILSAAAASLRSEELLADLRWASSSKEAAVALIAEEARQATSQELSSCT